MSIDSQRLEIEQVLRKVSAWQERLPDFDRLTAMTARHWLGLAMTARGMTDRALVAALADVPEAESLRDLLREQTFGLELNGETLFDRFVEDAGARESGLRRRYLRRLADSAPSLWRIERVERGVGMSVSPWEGGPTVRVSERDHSRSAGTDEILMTRVIDMPAGPVFGQGMLFFRNADSHAPTDSAETVRELLSHYATLQLDAAKARGARGRDAGGAGRGSGRDAGRDAGRNAGRGGGAGAGGRPGPDAAPRGTSSPSDTERGRLLERVRKLYAMAQEVEASPHEAEIALRRCQSLMAKYGITEADLETSAFGQAELRTGRTVPMHVKYLAAAVARLHDVLFVTGAAGFAEFRGFEVDANVARLTLDYLLDAVERALTARKRAGDFPAGRSAAYDYRVGFAIEVGKRASALVAERDKAERQAGGGTGTALAIRKREIVERECGGDLSTSSFRGRGARDAAARAAGHDDGARVSLDRQVDGTPARPALPSR